MRPSARRLLLVGINYAPEETGIAPYTTDLAEHLSDSGWSVRVLTGIPHYPHWRVPAKYRGTLRTRETPNGVDVHRFRHYVPSHQTALRRATYELTFLANATMAREPRPDCVVGVIPSLGGGVIAAERAQRHRVPFALVIQDLMGPAAAQSGIPGGGIAARPAQALERWVTTRAAGVAVVAESFRPYLQRLGVAPERIIHVGNWSHVSPPTGPRQYWRQVLGWSADQHIVLHAGNMGYKQGLDNVVEAARLAAATGSRNRFVLMGDGSDRARLQAAGSGLPTLQFLDPQPHDAFMDVLAAADVLLLNEQSTVVDMSLPSKITSYFLAGRPVVAAVRDDGSTAAELRRSGAALVVPPRNPPALLAALATLAEDSGLRDELRTRGVAHAQANFDKATQLQRAERFIARLCQAQALKGR